MRERVERREVRSFWRGRGGGGGEDFESLLKQVDQFTSLNWEEVFREYSRRAEGFVFERWTIRWFWEMYLFSLLEGGRVFVGADLGRREGEGGGEERGGEERGGEDDGVRARAEIRGLAKAIGKLLLDCRN